MRRCGLPGIAPRPGSGRQSYKLAGSGARPYPARRWTSPPLTETTLFTLVVKVEAHGQTIEEHFTA